MRLGKGIKFNMIIAILLCMAFVVNIGATFALATYSFTASSINIKDGETVKNETYTEYANAKAISGQYTYSIGTANNRLSIDYGFSHNHDLMVEFTATYSNPNHKAKDFSLNFVNRDDWCIDMLGINSGFNAVEKVGENDIALPSYVLSSESNTLRGVMYYMKTLSGSGILPIISGVNFYTSPNNSYTYIGDTLTVTLTPYYIKSNSENYDANHSFASRLLYSNNTTAFENWIDYKSGATAKAGNPTYMVYNSYVSGTDLRDTATTDNDIDTSLAYPSDFDWTASGFNIVGQEETLYSNTAYRYAVNQTSQVVNSETRYTLARDYSSVTAGNKYYGGLGVYVIPNTTLATVSITLDYHWQKDGVVDDQAPNNMVKLKYADDISVVTTVIEDDPETTEKNEAQQYDTYYYRDNIEAPTYINVLDYIMLTAESGYGTILANGYSLIITNFSIEVQASNPSGWTASSKLNYEVNNASQQSPILVRIKDVATGYKEIETNVSISNYGESTLEVTAFKVTAKLWYANYADESHSQFSEAIMGYLPEKTGSIDCLKYDKNIWTVTYRNNAFEFARNNASAYIPTGYTIPLITGVTIPQQYYPTGGDAGFTALTTVDGVTTYKPIEVNDFWCSLEVSDIVTGAPAEYNSGTYTGVEVVTDGYYSTIALGSSVPMYIRNNTNQNITAVSLDELRVVGFDANKSASLLPRDRINSSLDVNYSLTTHISANTIIRPNEMVLAYTITPTANAIIYSYEISATLSSGDASNGINLIFDRTLQTISGNTIQNVATGGIINDSETHYEFRIKSSQKLADYTQAEPTSDYFINPSDFVEQKINDTTYYYYYKGVICAHQYMVVFDSYVGVTIEYIAHVDGAVATDYESGDYTNTIWNPTYNATTGNVTDTTWNPPTDWLTAMQKIYGEPTASDRQSATVVTRA